MSDTDRDDHAPSLLERGQGVLLGAAMGDALGWPQERLSGRSEKHRTPESLSLGPMFVSWVRRTGGRYFPHEENIRAGEYSDDTQLLLCTARSLLVGKEWWKHMATCELPFWTVYERGGGASTKRAANQWLAGQAPWSPEVKAEERLSYFAAGGNGAAMRVSPHCMVLADSPDFARVAKDITINAVCTHGHPRALVGALAYSFGIWCAIRQKGTLEYGKLIEIARSRVDDWSTLPDLGEAWPGWRQAADEPFDGRYADIWHETVSEMLTLLERAQHGMQQEALSVDHDVLAQLGCFDRRVNGAGTVTAAASIFLASRYAADPVHGVLEAAFSVGADTDTVGSMTGGLLGALHGMDWLGSTPNHLQDSQYLRTTAARLVNGTADSEREVPAVHLLRGSVNATKERVERAAEGDTLKLPDGRQARICARQNLSSRSRSIDAFMWKVVTADGQTLYVKKISRKSVDQSRSLPSNAETFEQGSTDSEETDGIIKVGFRLSVRDVQKSRDFYANAFGLRVAHESNTVVNMEGVLALVPAAEGDSQRNSRTRTRRRKDQAFVLFIETKSLESAYVRAQRHDVAILVPPTDAGVRRFFQCCDLDGHIVEVYQRKAGTKASDASTVLGEFRS
jgi:ADP-ribosylglycohydrolase/catechol 2,3-dioxygenase-like lactoylglutathione lyase family enzyme